MIKIELELPDWVEGKHIYIMAGIELAAYKHLNKPWKVKTGRCNMCGKCCMNFKRDRDTFPRIKDGKCEFLIPDGKDKKVCGLRFNRPWVCSVATRPENVPECTEKFE